MRRRSPVDPTVSVSMCADPGFSKRQLHERSIRYLHPRTLGAPAEGRLAAGSGRLDDLLQFGIRVFLIEPGAMTTGIFSTSW
jgi:hypothetical protein